MRYFYFIASVFILTGCTSKPDREETSRQIETILSKPKGSFAVAYKDLLTGEEILINEHALFHAASTMKTPVMAEVYRQVAEGKFSLKDSVLIKNDFISILDGSSFSITRESDSDTLIYDHIGEKRTVYSLMYDMIIISSNLATNLIVELVDAKNVTQTMRSIGANDIQVLRGVEDTKAYEAGMNNQVTAYDLMLLFEKIDKEEIVNAEASMAMMDILLDQKFNDIIPAKLPAEVKVAHKTGSITGVRHDSGIVFLPDGKKYVLVLLSKDLEDEDAGVQAMAEVSEVLYQYTIQK
ncbi:MAG: serine hydrolase [Cyclobacteriaceae bacterium]|nr:MAG: serine hydrolase [Cyclobacteriaceae bacterium]